MAEIRIFHQVSGKIKMSRDIDDINSINKKDLLWIDLLDVDEKTEDRLEDFLKIDIQEDEEMEEIEMSSRYIETADSLVVNVNYLKNDFNTETVSFILKNDILVTVHDNLYSSITNAMRKVLSIPRNFPTGYHAMVALLEEKVEVDADMIEGVIDNISKLSDTLNEADEDVLMEITRMQEQIIMIRQNIIEKQRVISNLLRSELVPHELNTKLTIVLKDVNSLVEHAKFSFERLDYLQDTFLGLVNIQQNKIIKIFTIVSIIFLPPTLIASIFGENFDYMPIVHDINGFNISLIFMAFSAILLLIIFRIKKWL